MLINSKLLILLISITLNAEGIIAGGHSKNSGFVQLPHLKTNDTAFQAENNHCFIQKYALYFTMVFLLPLFICSVKSYTPIREFIMTMQGITYLILNLIMVHKIVKLLHNGILSRTFCTLMQHKGFHRYWNKIPKKPEKRMANFPNINYFLQCVH